MTFGDPSDFAIRGSILAHRGRWILGTILFEVKGETIGNPDDATDMLGCRSWMKDFLSRPRELVDDELVQMDPDQFFRIVYDPCMVDAGSGTIGAPTRARYPDAYRRFSIAHLGMSSFDRYDLCLLPIPNGDRLIWRQNGVPPRAHDVLPDRFRAVTADFVAWMDAVLHPIVQDILTTPGTTTTTKYLGRYSGTVTDLVAPDGRGVRFDENGNFRALLDPGE